MLIVEHPREPGCPHHRTWPYGLQIIAIERDIEGATDDLHAFLRFDDPHDAFCELYSTPLNADQDQVVGAGIQLDDLVGHATERTIERARVEDHGRLSGHSRNIAQLSR
jgi:hypothetical protein